MSRIRGLTDDSIQEELAKTFFASSAKKEKEKKSPKTPWIISGLAVFLALLVIFRSHIDIKISIRPAPRPAQKEVFFIEGGKPNAYVIKDMSFLGDARKFSKEKDDMLILVNSKGWGWGNFSIELKRPMNLEGFDVSYVAKGEIGDERLILVLLDADNKSYRMPRDLSSALTNQWQEHTINLKSTRKAIDLSRIWTVRFEIGGLTAGNYPAATVFLKDIRIKKSRI